LIPIALLQTLSPELIAQQFKVDEPIPLFKANSNTSPTQNVVAIHLKVESTDEALSWVC